MKKLDKKKIKYLTIIIIICIIGYFVYDYINENAEKSDGNTVAMGQIENSKTYTGYIVKEETIVDIDSSKASVPIIAEGQKSAKGQTISIYSTKESLESSKELSRMDAEILEANKNLPEIYDSEVQAMDSEILSKVKSIEGETSYTNIQDTKTAVNNLLNQRARIVSENSPQGSIVRSLIATRNSYETSIKSSKDNIKAPKSGVISYKLDGLENDKTFNNLGIVDFADIKERLKNQKISNGIKIVNNFEAYIIIEITGVDSKYLENGKTNKIRIVGIKNTVLNGTIYRVRKLDDDKYEVMYKITDDIEGLASIREVEVEIVWLSSYGLYIPNKTIKTKNDITYITVFRYGEKIDVPITVTRKNDKFSIITNINNKSSLKGNWSNYNVKVYDQLRID